MTRREYLDARGRSRRPATPRFPPHWTVHLLGSAGELLSRSQRSRTASSAAPRVGRSSGACARAGGTSSGAREGRASRLIRPLARALLRRDSPRRKGGKQSQKERQREKILRKGQVIRIRPFEAAARIRRRFRRFAAARPSLRPPSSFSKQSPSLSLSSPLRRARRPRAHGPAQGLRGRPPSPTKPRSPNTRGSTAWTPSISALSAGSRAARRAAREDGQGLGVRQGAAQGDPRGGKGRADDFPSARPSSPRYASRRTRRARGAALRFFRAEYARARTRAALPDSQERQSPVP